MILVIDTETTGLAQGSEPIEIALVRVNEGEIRSWDHSVVRSAKVVEIEARAAHHIQQEEIDKAPLLVDVVPGWLHEWPTHIAAHNAVFDKRIMEPYLFGLNLHMMPWICTYKCAVKLWPDLYSHKLQSIRYSLGLKVTIPVGLYPHRALYDALVCAALLQHMLTQPGVTLDQLESWSGAPLLLSKVPMGTHRGKKWKDVPRDYLNWILRQSDMSEDIHATARYWIEQR